MNRIAVLAVSVLLLAAPASAVGTLQYFDSLGGQGVTALYGPNNGLVSDIDYNAGSAEGGSLLFGASEITIIPLGDAVLTAFVCQLAAGCVSGTDYVFTAGGAGVGSIVVSDSDSNAQNSVLELGDITWDSLASGSLYLSSCNYTDASATERTCSPFTLAATVPEPSTGALIAAVLAAFAVARRNRRD
jgi:PEP-CTERM motif-containing protein